MVYPYARRIIWTLALILSSFSLAFGQAQLRVNESVTRIHIQPKGNALSLSVKLAIDNLTPRTIPVHIVVELVNRQGKVLSHAEQDDPLPPASTVLKISFPPEDSGKGGSQRDELLWDRLRYTLTPQPPDPAKPLEGIIAVSEIAPQLFELHVAGSAQIRAGRPSTLRVRAVQPITGRPVRGVDLQLSLNLDSEDDGPPLIRKAVTGLDGFAFFTFSIPADAPLPDDNELEATVTGTLGGFSVAANQNLYLRSFASGSLSTDKPLYQPGQTVHMRLLTFDRDRKAWADQPVTFEIEDPEDTTEYVAHARTSRFGIATADWQIPENLRLGDYNIKAKFDDDEHEESWGRGRVKISRYELPTFTVKPKPDQSYYLPGQNAEVEVRADYLFGKPVRRGHVRVVREESRDWNYREQKWDIKEAASYEGDTDDKGRYVAKVDLSHDHSELAGEENDRFRDLTLAAYFTDSSSRRTEQRRFDLRITKQPIHVYLTGEQGSDVEGLPMTFMVSTDYADGTPAPCDVEIDWVVEPYTGYRDPNAVLSRHLRRIRTHRFGLAKVSDLKIPDDPDYGDASLRVHAIGRAGASGEIKQELRYYDEPVLRVATDKSLYRPEEPIAVTLSTNEHGLTVFVEAIADFRVLSSQTVEMAGRSATVEIPPNAKFQGEVSILAYAFRNRNRENSSRRELSASRAVLFPKNHAIHLDAHTDQPTYRPGDEASVNLRVTGPEGQPLEGALGLVVVDKALEERQRTDQEFGGSRGFYGFLEREDAFKGVHQSDLDKIDLSQPLLPGLDLVAEGLLRSRYGYAGHFFSDSGRKQLRQAFASLIDPQVDLISKALDQRYQRSREYPKSMTDLKAYLAADGIQFANLHDPWGLPYLTQFHFDRQFEVLTISSSSLDKVGHTPDDFEVSSFQWPYFRDHADTLQKALYAFHARTGGYIRDLPALRDELHQEHVDLDSWKDPWGHTYHYKFDVALTHYNVTVMSAGPDGRFETEAEPSGDDFELSTVGVDYTMEMQRTLNNALSQYVEEKQTFPQNMDELRKVLKASGVDFDSFKDPWGNRYYGTFRQEATYADMIKVESYAEYVQGRPHPTQTVPVTRQMEWVYFRSAGHDGIEGTADDFTTSTFSRIISEQTSHNKTPTAARDQSVLKEGNGAISGVVLDSSGARVAGVKVTAKNLTTEQLFAATTGPDGLYILSLPAGPYLVKAFHPGFKTYNITDVPVQVSNITQLDIALELGTVTDTVQVTAEALSLETETCSLAMVVSKPDTASCSDLSKLSTPRLRDYFPETLLWQPELITDVKGRAQVKFPLAGSITTWTLKAVASTVNGEIGTAEKEIRAFQPFFIEHDPPRVLTVGDQIELPVVLRNYLDHSLQAQVQMSPQSWYTLANPEKQTVEIPAGDSSRTVFGFTATTPVKQGKQRVTALSNGVSDAIEKTVAVHPDGQELTKTVSQVFNDKAALELQIPGNSVPRSLEATLKIYLNLNAHVLESIEAIMQRPYGCAEQTISTAYASLLYLRLVGDAGKNSAMYTRALQNVQLGYSRLLSYQSEDGGITYWGRGEPALALTAYAVQFLDDASDYVTIDETVTRQAVTWLLKQQQIDGRWIAHTWWYDKQKEDVRASAQLTAYIARVLATTGETKPGDTDESKKYAASINNALNSALPYVEPHAAEIDEPYLIAAYTLAALASGQESRATAGLTRLRALEHREGTASYWTLEMNTPFYGWGLPGRLEATGLVVQALEASEKIHGHTPQDDELISRGLLFLLKNQDRYGIWYSTQATIDVLDAIAEFTASKADKAVATAAVLARADVVIDGKQVTSIDLPACKTICSPVVADISAYLSPGEHRVEIRRPAGSPAASVQLLADYYVPWTHTAVTTDLHQEKSLSDALRLAVHFDKESAQPGETVTCRVDAERVRFRGYGMMLAEIGLPPGAEVDRATLEKAMTDSGWDINQYDILPDRVVLYLWPRAGGVKFSFGFKFRYGMKALSAPSVLYDYYNPEARAEVEPVKFLVQ